MSGVTVPVFRTKQRQSANKTSLSSAMMLETPAKLTASPQLNPIYLYSVSILRCAAPLTSPIRPAAQLTSLL